MADIIFLDVKPYNGLEVRAAAAGGVQHGTTSLAEAFARQGHSVTVYTPLKTELDLHGVRWRPLEQAAGLRAELFIVNNAVHLLDRAREGKKVVWFRNPVKLYRLLKKGDLLPIFRHRPHAVFLGRYHADAVSSLLPFASRRIIQHATPIEFARSEPLMAAPPRRALFVSQAYRGLDWLLDVWATKIHPLVPDAELHVFSAASSRVRATGYEQFGVVRHSRIPRSELAKSMMDARLLLYPGHEHETFCFAAAEATAAGVPVITRGIGSLGERVTDGVNGHVRWEPDDFAECAIRLLRDDQMWLAMHRSTLMSRSITSWDDRAIEWAKAFIKPDRDAPDQNSNPLGVIPTLAK